MANDGWILGSAQRHRVAVLSCRTLQFPLNLDQTASTTYQADPKRQHDFTSPRHPSFSITSSEDRCCKAVIKELSLLRGDKKLKQDQQYTNNSALKFAAMSTMSTSLSIPNLANTCAILCQNAKTQHFRNNFNSNILNIFQQFPCAEALAAPRQVRWQSARLHIALWDTCCKSHSSTKCEKSTEKRDMSALASSRCLYFWIGLQTAVCLWNWRPNLFEPSPARAERRAWMLWLAADTNLRCIRWHRDTQHCETNTYSKNLKNSISSSTPFRSMQSFGSPSRLSFSLPPPGDRTHRGQNKTQSIHHTQFSPVD